MGKSNSVNEHALNREPVPLNGKWVDMHRLQTRFVIGWENNRDGDITMPLSLKRIEMK